jgi:hypothetical protein
MNRTAIRLFSQAQAGSIINRSQMSTPLFFYAGSLFDNRGSVQFRSSEEFPTLFLSSASTFRNGGLLNVSVPSPTEFEIYGGTFLNLDSGVIRHNSITSLLFTTDSASTSTIGGQLLVPQVQFKQGSHAINCSSCPPFIGKSSAVLILDNTVPVPHLKVAGCTLRGSSAFSYYAVDRLELESGTVDVFLNVSSLAATGSISLSKSLIVSKNASISGSITLTPSVELVILQNAVVSIPGLVDDCVGSTQCGKIKNYGSITLPDGGEMRTNTVNFGAVRLGTNPPYALDRCFLKNVGNSTFQFSSCSDIERNSLCCFVQKFRRLLFRVPVANAVASGLGVQIAYLRIVEGSKQALAGWESLNFRERSLSRQVQC